MMHPTRRLTLGMLAAGIALPPGTRTASLDYGLAQTALALGATLVGLPDPSDYRNWVVKPDLPRTVRDLGQRTQPNLEVLRALRPGLILAIADHLPIVPLLEAVAPVLMLPIHTAGRQPWALSTDAARQIGAKLGRAVEAEHLIAEVEARYAASRAALAGRSQRPVLIASLLDPRHLSVYGAGSILDDALARLGLRNAWTGATGRWGSATVPVERLAALGDPTLALIEPVPQDADAALKASPLWQALPFVRAGRVIRLPPVLMFGTLPAADRFASLLLPRLLAGDPDV